MVYTQVCIVGKDAVRHLGGFMVNSYVDLMLKCVINASALSHMESEADSQT